MLLFKITGTCLRKGCNFIHFNSNAAHPDYSSESEARKTMPYPRENRSNVNKDEPFSRLFPTRAPGNSGRQFHGPHHPFGPNQANSLSVPLVNQTIFVGQGHQFWPVQEGMV